MLGSSFDRLMSKHPILARIAGNRLDAFFSTSTLSNACCSVAASLGAGLISLLGNDLLYYITFSVMAVVWLQTAVLSGFRKQWFFNFFAVVFWLMPHIFIDAAKSVTRSEGMDGINDMLVFASRVFTEFSVKALLPLTGGGLTLSIIIAGIITAASLLGYYIRSGARHSDFYCRKRLNQLK